MVNTQLTNHFSIGNQNHFSIPGKIKHAQRLPDLQPSILGKIKHASTSNQNITPRIPMTTKDNDKSPFAPHLIVTSGDVEFRQQQEGHQTATKQGPAPAAGSLGARLVSGFNPKISLDLQPPDVSVV